MSSIKLLDCTLRDGARIIEGQFSNDAITGIADKLSRANIDIIEVGFMRDANVVNYTGNSTSFTDVSQIDAIIPQNGRNTEYVAFIDFNQYDFTAMKPVGQSRLSGFRIGFTKKDFTTNYKAVVSAFRTVKENGYKLYIQGVNSLNYTDIEMLKVLEMVNEVKPVSYGIVDTYGAMYVDDVTRIYGLIDHNLDKDIAIDFHSHNNYQLSFSFAQEVIRLSYNTRNIIIDATLDGMAKGAGNLCTELIADYLVRKMNYNYSINLLFDTIDEYLYEIIEKYDWGYSPTSLLAGIYRTNPNNVIYLTKKFRFNTNDIKNILAMLTDEEREEKAYERIDDLIVEYNDNHYNDTAEIEKLKKVFSGNSVLVLASGNTLNTHKNVIQDYVLCCHPLIISVNFVSDYKDAYSFFANKKRFTPESKSERTIVTSNVSKDISKGLIVNYLDLISHGYKMYDNSTIMLLNLLVRIGVEDIAIAGMDGMSHGKCNYFDERLNIERLDSRLDEINAEVSEALRDYVLKLKNCKIKFITPSIHEKILEEK